MLNGLGSWNLTPEMRVRFPLGTLRHTTGSTRTLERSKGRCAFLSVVCRKSPCLGGPSSGLRSHLSPFNSEQGDHRASVLVVPGASLRSLPPGFDSRQRLSVMHCRSRRPRVGGGSHKADREGSNPSVATIDYRSPRCGSIWLKHRVRDAGIAGSNPATSTMK